jgi:hypothetical protein
MWFRIFSTIFCICFTHCCAAQQIELFIANDTLFVQPDSIIELPVRAKDFKEVIGFECTIKWDSSALQFVAIDSTVVPTIVPNKNANGRLRLLWANAVGLTLADSMTLLKLYFRTAQREPLISKISFESLDFYAIQPNNSIVSVPAVGMDQWIVIRTCRTDVSLGPDLPVCPGETARISVNCTNCNSFYWSDGYLGSVRWIDTALMLSVAARGAFRCTAADTLQINLAPVPILKMQREQVLCPGGSIILLSEQQGAEKFRWSTGSTTSSITIDKSGIYRLTVTNTEGCTASDSTLVNQNGPTNAILTVEQPNCQRLQGSVSISNIQGGVPPYVYAANNGAWGQSNRFNLEEGRIHEIAVQDANGCEWRDTAILKPVYLPTLAISPPKSVLMVGDSVLLSISIPANYPDSLIERLTWTTLEGLTLNNALPTQAWAKPTRTTTYVATLWSKDGCVASDSTQILIKQIGNWRLFAPNVITPESGRGNGTFSLHLQDARIEKVNRLVIYDRWGSMVFESRNPNPVWNGQMPHGSAAPTGVFMWMSELALVEGGTAIITGEIAVVR